MKYLDRFNENILNDKVYLVTYSETDEIHMNLCTEEDYNKACDLIDKTYSENKRVDWSKVMESFYDIDEKGNVIKDKWIKKTFTQTGCVEDWPFKDYNISGMIHVIME